MKEKKDPRVAQTVWELFEATGQIGYYNLYRALDPDPRP